MYNKLLRNLFYSSQKPASFSCEEKLYHHAKRLEPRITHKIVRKWLSEQHTHQLHRKVKKQFPTLHVVVPGPNHQVDADLMFVRKAASQNSGTQYLLVVIDVFSRKAFVQPIRVKTAATVLHAFKKIFSLHPVKVVRTDRGTEFMSVFHKFLVNNNVKHFFAYGNHKANFAERFIRTLRGKILRYLNYRNTKKYVDVLPSLVESYNNTIHSSIGMAPNNVNKHNVKNLRKQLYPSKTTQSKFHFKLGDVVRTVQKRSHFAKDSEQRWSDEVFEVYGRISGNPSVYMLQDMLGEQLKGKFYKDELQLAKQNALAHQKIDSF